MTDGTERCPTCGSRLWVYTTEVGNHGPQNGGPSTEKRQLPDDSDVSQPDRNTTEVDSTDDTPPRPRISPEKMQEAYEKAKEDFRRNGGNV